MQPHLLVHLGGGGIVGVIVGLVLWANLKTTTVNSFGIATEELWGFTNPLAFAIAVGVVFGVAWLIIQNVTGKTE